MTKFAINMLFGLMLVCGLLIADYSEPNAQQHDTAVVDTFDPATGTITRTNNPH